MSLKTIETELEKPVNKGTVDVTRDGATVNNVVVEAPILDDWTPVFALFNLDPTEFGVVDDTVRMTTWQQSKGLEDGTRATVQLYSYSARFRRKALKKDIAALVKAAKRRPSKQSTQNGASGSHAFIVALGDLQLGKMDGDGVEGTTARFYAGITDTLTAYKRKAKGAPVYLIHLGDCIEGFVSQGGANTWRTTLPITEQQDLYETLLLDQVKAFAGTAPEIHLVGVPGNHDEASRPIHLYSDSWAIQAVNSVRRATALAGNYEHVTYHTPARDELTVTLDICGTTVGMAHGHQWRPGQAVQWWAKQAHGRQPIGDADLLLSAHLHHLRIESTGSDKTWLQVPALESGSMWWKHRTGEWGQPGVVTALVGGGSWSGLEIL